MSDKPSLDRPSVPTRTGWPSFWISFAVAVGTVVLMTALRWLLDPVLGEHHPFQLFIAAVILATWFSGWQSGVLALVLGFFTADYLFIHPRGALGPLGTDQTVGLILYVLVSAISIGLIEKTSRAQQRSEFDSHRLNAEIVEHQRTQLALLQAQAELQQRVVQRTQQLSEATGQLREETTARFEAEIREQRLAAVVASSEDAIVAIDSSGLITDWNIGAEHLFGYTAAEATGQNIFLLVPPEDKERGELTLEKLRDGKDIPPYEAERSRKDGSRVVVSVRLSTIRRQGIMDGFSLIYRDLTYTKQLEQQLQQTAKMEAIGQLAGGVAHDFNNLLTIISGYSDILLSHSGSDEFAKNMLDEILRASERAAALTRQLLAFSRKQVLQLRVIDLNDIVRDSEKMLRRLIGEDVQLATALHSRLAPVKVDSGQIEQVIMNLAVNARDAMPRGGRLTIETANADLDEAYAASRPGVWPGRYVMLAVSDTGTGMDEKTKSRIFEPFFTTKEFGKGTGLGLAVVHGIIKQSGGHIAIYSEINRGTTFKIYLPAVEKPRTASQSDPAIRIVPRGTETILLVEDEPGVRQLSRTALQNVGYSVLEAGHGGEAVHVAEKHEGPIHLLLSDVVMPEMGGRLLAERLAVSKPGIKVLFMSGYTDDAVVRHGVLEAEMAFLQKPFSPRQLAQKVREVLDQ